MAFNYIISHLTPFFIFLFNLNIFLDNKYATKEFKNDANTMAHIRFSPTIDQQKELINDLKNKNQENSPTDGVNTGVSGQFVVQYDVSRDFKGGSMVVSILNSFIFYLQFA